LKGQGNWMRMLVAVEAHVLATKVAAAGGERIIVCSGYFFYQGFLDSAAELGIPKVARSKPYLTVNVPTTTNLTTTKAEDLLGLKGSERAAVCRHQRHVEGVVVPHHTQGHCDHVDGEAMTGMGTMAATTAVMVMNKAD